MSGVPRAAATPHPSKTPNISTDIFTMLRFLQTIYPSLILLIWQINQWENYLPFKDSSYFPQSSRIKPNILNTVDPTTQCAMCHVVWFVLDPLLINFLVVFNLPFSSACDQGADVQSRRWGLWSPWGRGQVLGQDMMTLLFPLSSSRNYSHRPLKTPAPCTQNKTVSHHLFLIPCGDWRPTVVLIILMLTREGRWTQVMRLSFLSSFMIGGLNRIQTGGRLNRNFYSIHCEETQTFCDILALCECLALVWALFGSPWALNTRHRSCLLFMCESSSAIISHLPIMNVKRTYSSSTLSSPKSSS